MPSKGKQKGNAYERELVKQFQVAGLEAKRAWGSNGQAMGEHEEVDVLVQYTQTSHNIINTSKAFNASIVENKNRRLKLQAKRRKKLPNFLGLTEYVDAAVFRQDNDESYIMMRLEDFIERFLK